MKQIGFLEYYTIVGYRFRIRNAVKQQMSQRINEHILANYSFPNIKSEILELLISTDGTAEELVVTKNSKTTRGKHLSYSLWLPYPKIVQNGQTNLAIFIAEIFKGLTQILTEYGVEISEIEEVQKEVEEEIIGNEKYMYRPTASQSALDKILGRNTPEVPEKMNP